MTTINIKELGEWKKGTTIKFKTKKEALKRLELLKHNNESNNDFRNLKIQKIEGDKLNEGWVINFEYK